jgi:hypothetical protein
MRGTAASMRAARPPSLVLLPARRPIRVVARAAPAASRWARTTAPPPHRRHRAPTPVVVAAAASSKNSNPLARALERELGVQSASLDPRLREAVERAVERAPERRVTAGDAAAAAGVPLADADRALRTLAYDCLATLEVSSSGDVAYTFPRDFRAELARKSLRVRAVPLLRRAEEVAAFLVRAAFGAALVASAALVWAAVAVLSSSSQRDDRRGGGGGFGGGRGGGVYLWVDPLDWLLFWDPRYARRQRARADRGDRLSFLEAVFSFVFGDGDPNENFAARRWRALAAHVRRLGGVVSAEEMAPFLDPPRLARDTRSGRLLRGEEGGASSSSSLGRYGADESFVLPALLRLNGEAFVDESSGRLLYRFPDLQATAAAGGGGQGSWFDALRSSSSSSTVKVPLERQWDFSAASPGQQAAALALGVANLAGVVILGGMLQDPVARLALVREGLGFVLGAMPWLQAYAFAFFAIPIVRAVVDARRNAAVVSRNAAREDAVELLREGDAALRAKQEVARRLGGKRVVGGGAGGDVVYTTETDTDAQRNAAEQREFDERLRAASAGGKPRLVDDVFDRRGAGGRGAEREKERQRERAVGRRDGGDDWDRLDRW